MSVLRVSPTNESQVAEAVREAAEKGTSFEIVSGGSKRGFGRPVAADAVLDVSALSGIVKYEPEELVLTARAATPIREIQAALAEKKQMLGFEPADWGPVFGAQPGRGTLGGIVATNACGARRVKAGAVRDSVIGCRFINGSGEVIKAGGHVIKNVTGFDLPRLMCGAFGTLGVLTEITLRVSPAPERVAALALTSEVANGLRILREALRLPLDATGLAYMPDVYSQSQGTTPRRGVALVRVEGPEASLDSKLADLSAHFDSRNALVLNDDAARGLFRDIDNCRLFTDCTSDIWRLCVPPSEAHAALEASKAHYWYADWAGGLLWLWLPADEETAARLRAITAQFSGHATLMRGSDEARTNLAVFEPETLARAALTRSVKAAFDPRRMFNPGRMYKGF